MDPNWKSDLERGELFEAKVRALLGGVKPEFGQRDYGDIRLNSGLYIECKHDEAFDTYGNACFELADLENVNQRAILTGVLKHAAYGHPVVVVHALGAACNQVLVYSPYEVVDYLQNQSYSPRWKVKVWPSQDKDRRSARDRTTGLLVPLRDLTVNDNGPGQPVPPARPRIPVSLCAPTDVVAAVHTIAARTTVGPWLYRTPQHIFSDVTSALAHGPADQEIKRCQRRVSVK